MFLLYNLYFIAYAIIGVPIFPLLPPSTQTLQLPQAILTAKGHAYIFSGYYIHYVVLYISMTILKLPIRTPFFIFKDFIHLFLERGERREKVRDRNIDV